MAGQGHSGSKPLGPQTPVSLPRAPCTVLCSHQPPLGPLDKWSLIIYDGALQLRVNHPNIFCKSNEGSVMRDLATAPVTKSWPRSRPDCVGISPSPLFQRITGFAD